MRRTLLLALTLTVSTTTSAHAEGLLDELFAAHPKRFQAVVSEASARRLQVLVTEIGTPEDPLALVRHSYRVGAEYLYPASALKPAAAIAAIQTLQALVGPNAPAVDLQSPVTLSAGEQKQKTTLALAIRKTLVVSSNKAYNQLYDIAGQTGLNQAMWNAGLKTVRLNHRLSVILSVEENRRTAAWTTRLNGRRHTIQGQTSSLDLVNISSSRLDVGQAYRDRGSLIQHPMNFAQKNHMGLRALQDLLLLLVRPETRHGLPGFGLAESHRTYLLDALTALPHESRWPVWRREDFDPYRYKPFLRGLERVQPRRQFRLISKAGKAYGFRIDNAYVEDVRTGRAFLITAGLHVDMDGTLNDDKYDYELADRFLADLAEAVSRTLWKSPSR